MSKSQIGKHDDRRTRWSKHIRNRLDEILGKPFVIPQESIEFIEFMEAKPIDAVILDRLCKERGLGVANPTEAQRRNFEADEERETWPTRTRNNRERFDADHAVLRFLSVDGKYFGGTEPHQIDRVIKKFYCYGDRDALGMATGRLVRWFAKWFPEEAEIVL